MRAPFELVKEPRDPTGVRCCPFCLRPVLWRYPLPTRVDYRPALLGEPLCLVHGNLRAWYVLKLMYGRPVITAVGRRRRAGWALQRPVPARRRKAHRLIDYGHRRSQTAFEKHTLHRQLSLPDLQALPVREPDAHHAVGR